LTSTVARFFICSVLLYAPPYATGRQSGNATDHSLANALELKILAKPADKKAINSFIDDVRKQFFAAKNIDSLKARAVVIKALQTIDRIEPLSHEARKRLAVAKENVTCYRRLIDADDAKFETLEQRLLEDPNDFENFLLYEIKFHSQDDMLYEKESRAKAFERLDNVASVLNSTRAKTLDKRIADECKILIERITKLHKPRIEKAQSRLSLIGTRAVFPSGDHGSWLHGPALNDEDFNEKVVLIDFMALWCRPCIAGFPKVDQWRLKYSANGLVVISVARQKDGPKATTQTERIDALFRQKNIGLRCFIDDGALFDAHHVEGVPHYTLIDRAGIIRMVRTGNFTQNEIEGEIEKLLSERRN
jgi:thiol-disulfide isomerase/thioredoxin